MQRAFLFVHRYLALAAAAILIVVALSGAALGFEGAIDRALNEDLWEVEPAATSMSVDDLLTRVRGAYPDVTVVGVTPSPADGRATVVSAGDGTQLFMNPYTGKILGTRSPSERDASLARRLHVFHETLLAGKVGNVVVGIATVMALVLVLSGLVVWWPRKLWRMRIGASWKRVVFDLHHLLGVSTAIVLLFISASGAVIMYPVLGELLGKLDRSSPAPRPVQPAADPGMRPLSVDSVVRVASGTLRGATVMNVSMPPDMKAPLAVAMRFPEDRTPAGRSRVFVDRYRGTVLAVTNAREAGIGTRLNNLKRSIHTGDWFGAPTQVLWIFAALAMVAQAVTGVLMWWNGRAARAATTTRSAGAIT